MRGEPNETGCIVLRDSATHSSAESLLQDDCMQEVNASPLLEREKDRERASLSRGLSRPRGNGSIVAAA